MNDLEKSWKRTKPVKHKTCDGCGGNTKTAGPIKYLFGEILVKACRACCREPKELEKPIRDALKTWLKEQRKK